MSILRFVIIAIVLLVLASVLAVYTYGRFAKSARGPKSSALPIKDNETKIDKLVARLAEKTKELGPDQNALALVISNLDAFIARAAATAMAGRSLDLMYYIWDDDLTGRLLLKEVLDAAERGVRVRLLLDDINAQGRDPAYVALDQHPNIEIRMFNPSRSRNGGLRRGLEMMLRALTVTRRMHNKAFIVDGRLAFIGGRNIADSYFDAGQRSNFRDLDLILMGPAIKDVENIFDSFWNSSVALPIHALTVPGRSANPEEWRQKLSEFAASEQAKPYLSAVHDQVTLEQLLNPGQKLFPAHDVRVLSDPPEKALGKNPENWLMHYFEPIIEKAKTNLEITSPYFVPGNAGADRLCRLAKKNVDVKVLTNSLAATDVAAVHGGYSPYRKKLLRGGVKLYELKPDGGIRQRLRLFGSGRASLHTKAFLVDKKTGFVGSFNFDPRSASLNTEMGIMFICPQITMRMDILFAEETTGEMSYAVTMRRHNKLEWHSIENEKPKIIYHEPESRLWRRVYAKVISWLPIESQL